MRVYVGILAALLTGCSIIERPSKPVKKFLVQTQQALPAKPSQETKSFSLAVTSDVPSNRPYIKVFPHQIEFLCDTEWFESLEKMVEKSFVQNFQDAGMPIYKNASSAQFVNIHIRHFGLEYVPGKKILHVAYFVEVKDHPFGHILKSKLFDYSIEYLWSNDQNYVQDLSDAHFDLLKKIYTWL